MREYASPEPSEGESHTPASDVLVWGSAVPSSQFTHVIFVPRFTVTLCGMKVKFRMKITTVPAAGEDVGMRQSPAGTGPVDSCRSEKQPDTETAVTAETSTTGPVRARNIAQRRPVIRNHGSCITY